ncbi:MAG: O-antigen ligase family protein [Candidatus Hydrogenedentales bacterium]|jgi:hypothetical protein
MEASANYYGQTTLHPVGLAAVLILGVALVLLPRRFSVYPMIVMASFISSAQRVVISGLDFDLLRILVLFAWARVLSRNEFKGFLWNRLDSLLLAWMASGTIVYTLQQGTSSAFINRCGWMFVGLGLYFFFRCVLRDWQDLEHLVISFIVVSIPVAMAFAVEWATGRNAFSVFGGVPEITLVREGKFRCQGAFAHAILAGCFWASVMPLMVPFLVERRRWFAVVGLLASLFIVVASSSSTPVMAVIFGAAGMAFYPLRSHLRPIRYGFFAILVVLHFIMKGPVWSLIARISAVAGSTGWHRYSIMDATIRNFEKWWLLGEPDPMSWGVWEMRDITNQYILEGLQGGLLTLVLFIAGISTAFTMVGKALRQVESQPQERLLVFTVGVSLFVHVWSYFGVSYFGQILMLWYLTLAIVGSLDRMSGNEQPYSEDGGDPGFLEGRPYGPSYGGGLRKSV